jgi:hypothetical protein
MPRWISLFVLLMTIDAGGVADELDCNFDQRGPVVILP